MRQDITVMRGDTQSLIVTVTDSAGDPYDLTNGLITFSVKDLLTKTLSDGITVADPLTGVATVVIAAADTEGAPDQRYAYPYDVQVEVSGVVKTPIRGLFIVLPDVTT